MSQSNEMKWNLSEGYAWILFEAVIISVHIWIWITGMLMAVIRKKVFNKDFYQKKFLDINN
jgi:hypothetical protein